MILRPLQAAQTSGAGAAKVGGRFNRPGVDALYLSRGIETATAEYQQDEALMPPGTLVTYEVELSSIVDFEKGYSRGEWDELWSDWDCQWRRLALYEGIEPPSWLLADISMERGAKGIMFPSTRHRGGCNLVIYTQQLEDGDQLSAHDPRGELPKSQDSWVR